MRAYLIEYNLAGRYHTILETNKSIQEKKRELRKQCGEEFNVDDERYVDHIHKPLVQGLIEGPTPNP